MGRVSLSRPQAGLAPTEVRLVRVQGSQVRGNKVPFFMVVPLFKLPRWEAQQALGAAETFGQSAGGSREGLLSGVSIVASPKPNPQHQKGSRWQNTFSNQCNLLVRSWGGWRADGTPVRGDEPCPGSWARYSC